MQTFFRLFWILLLLLSLVWVAGGALVASGAVDDGGAASSLREDIIIFTDGLNVSPELPPSLLFVITGLPLALLSLFFAWRNHRRLTLRAEAQKQTRSEGSPSERRGTVFITALSLIFALLLWNARGIDALLAQGAPASDSFSLTAVTYPVRLFVTFVHEAGHALAALLTGGQVQSFTVSPDGSGYAITAGGNISLILPAGYLGAALFGALLFLLSSRAPSMTRALSLLLGIGFIALTLLFARPDASGNITALVVGVGYGLALAILGWAAPQAIIVFLLNTLAVLTGLNAVFDLVHLVSNADIGNAGVLNDAAAFSQNVAPLLPPSVVALLWAAIAVGMMGVAMYFGLLKPAQSELT
ncbi:MAG: M50 family metallopeptidase [Chloroflexi bacterium]|nr:M50 family metallopeptidase [Chloroflexota bacterium]MCY4247024.1 M50 family metallopeptidase [Chloroflexota bacterium]